MTQSNIFKLLIIYLLSILRSNSFSFTQFGVNNIHKKSTLNLNRIITLTKQYPHPTATTRREITSQLNAIDDKRRKQLGLADDEDEYDLDFALDQNTDPLITKIIAGSAIVAIIAVLVVGLIIPYTTDYGEGVCSPIQSGGRC